MQRTLLLLALLAAPVAASSASASSAATAWLRTHKVPTDDQLGELATANPQAFAIVSALLNKHAHHQQLAPEERGPDVFRKMMAADTSHLAAPEPRVALPYANPEADAEVQQVSAPVDNTKYDANEASNRDESSVSRLLAAVASMGGKKGKKIAALLNKRNQQDSNALTADASLFTEEAPPTQAPVAVEQAVEQAVEVPRVQAAAPVHKNSYLDGIDLSGDMPAVAGAKHHKHFANLDDSSPSSLATFSFGDSAPEAAAPKPRHVEAPKPKKENNSFLKWLGVVDKAPAPEDKPASVAPPAKKRNSYLDSVKFFG